MGRVHEKQGSKFLINRKHFLHTLTAIDYWLDFVQKPNVKPYRKFDEYQTFEAVKAYMEE